MDSRTRVANAIDRRELDRVPRFDSFWEDTLTLWRAQGLPTDVDPERYFDFDIAEMSLDLSMRQEQKLLATEGEFMVVQDRCGYTMRKIVGKSRALDFISHVTKDRATWDRLKDRFRFDPRATARIDDKSYFLHMDEYPSWAEAKAKYDRLRATGLYLAFVVYGPWEGTWRHRGFENLLMDLAGDEAWVCEMSETHMTMMLDTLKHCVSMGMKPDGLFFIEDLGCQRGLMFSPRTWRSVYKPLVATLGRYLRENGIHLLMHSCGNVEALIPDLIDCGLQVLQPLQASAGMDVRKLKREFGRDLAFWGNIDVRAMAGTDDEIEREIHDKITVAKVGGGYLYHSDHSVPPEVSFDRYRRIMDLVARYGTY